MSSKMAPDLLGQITNIFRGDNLNGIASLIGESPGKTQTALGSIAPALLATVAHKASTTEGANELLQIMKQNELDKVGPVDLSTTSSGTVNNLITSGKSILNSLLGTRASSAMDWVSQNSGINRASSSSLFGLAVPVVLGFIGRKVFSGTGGVSALQSLLGNPRSYLQTVPAGLTSALGLGDDVSAPRRMPTIERPVEPVDTSYVRPTLGSPWWRWVLPLALLIGALALLAYFLSPRPAVPTPVVETTQPAAPPATIPVTAPVATAVSNALGAFLDKTLPNGLALHIPSNGVESKLLAFIEDPARAVDKDTWFSFDRLEFESDSAKLKPSSHEQLANIASIMKAYPNVSIKIGGYTDNSGNPAHNLELSQARANATMNELANLGIAKSRLAAEGYGEQFPVADNSTEEGRQRNRRIDIRVTSK